MIEQPPHCTEPDPEPDPCLGPTPPAFCDFACTGSDLLEPNEPKGLLNAAWQHSYPGPSSPQNTRREVWWLVYFDGHSYTYVEPEYIEQSACNVRPRIYKSQLTPNLLFMIHTHPMKPNEVISAQSGCPANFHGVPYNTGISPPDSQSMVNLYDKFEVSVPLVVVDTDSVLIGTVESGQLHTSRFPRCNDS
jgi:hypothetical protein